MWRAWQISGVFFVACAIGVACIPDIAALQGSGGGATPTSTERPGRTTLGGAMNGIDIDIMAPNSQPMRLDGDSHSRGHGSPIPGCRVVSAVQRWEFSIILRSLAG